MAHNFKLTGDYYVSVDGSDSNNGLTKDTPKRTIQAGLNLLTTNNKTLVIGTGYYQETLSRSAALTGITIVGDGTVVLDGQGIRSFSLGFSNGNPALLSNIWLKNYPSCSISGFGTASWSISGIMYVGGFSTNSNHYFSRSILIGCTYTSNCCQFGLSIIINTNLTATGTAGAVFQDCYLSSSSVIYVTTSGGASMSYNNIQGAIAMNGATSVTTGVYQDVYGRYYDLSQAGSGGSGTISDPYKRSDTANKVFNFTTHRILYSTTNINSISLDPKFNDIQAQDFTLQADSPHIGRASDGISNIGGTNYAIRDAANGDVYFTNAVSRTNLAFIGDDQIVSGGSSGEVIGAPRFVSNTVKVLQKMTYNGLLEFNKAISGGTVGNRNVPDQEVYDSTLQPPNVAGANPDRLVYYMRFSTQVAQPATSGEWDNGGLWTAGNYETFEWNTKPCVDNVGVGNGSPSFNASATPVFIQATWIQLKIKLRNDYV